MSEKDYIWNPSTCACKIDKYLKSIIGDSVVTCAENVDVVATSYKEPICFDKKGNLYNRNFYILLVFLLITMSLLITVSIYPYKTSIKAKTYIVILP